MMAIFIQILPTRPDGRNQTAAWPPVGVSAQGLQQNAFISFGDRPLAPDNVYGKAARTHHPMKASSWGWNRPYF